MTEKSIAIVGAGAFGGWTAWNLQQRGAKVTLFDAWGPGHSRASSGGETRLIRGNYGQDRIYVEWVVRALGLWKEFDQRWDIPLYHKTGLLWMFVGEDDYAKLSIPVIEEFGLKVDQLSNGDAKERYPQVNFDDVQSIYIEQEAGYLKAREACRVVCQKFQEAGGTYQQLAVKPGFNDRGEIEHLNLSNGEKLVADEYVFACGPWLPELFPDVIGSGISISRQEVYYFGTPAGVESFDAGKFPAWLNFDEPLHYGVPAVDRRGFKICNDSRGESMHPTHDSRVPSGEGIEKARQFLGQPVPSTERCPVGRITSLPIQQQSRWAFGDRPTSPLSKSMDHWWRIGTQLQIGASSGGACSIVRTWSNKSTFDVFPRTLSRHFPARISTFHKLVGCRNVKTACYCVAPQVIWSQADSKSSSKVKVVNMIRSLIALLLISSTTLIAHAEEGKHLFILSGQSNMAGLKPEESFIPTVEKKFGKENVIVIKDAQGRPTHSSLVQKLETSRRGPAGSER